MAIVEGISAAKAAFEVSKVALDLTRHPKLDIHTIQDHLLELQGLILSAQRSLADAEDEIRELKRALDDQDRIRELQADLEMDLVGRYFVRKSEKERGLIPYCPTCWGSEMKLVPLTLYQFPGAFKCALHKVIFYSPEQFEIKKKENEASRQRGRQPLRGGGWS